MVYQIHRLIWNRIEIEVRYNPNHHGGIIAHLEIETIAPEREPLPITDTGYLSHFHTAGHIETKYDGDAVACVREWLDDRAKCPSWQRYVEDTRQLELF